mmetsp:Transcript_12555/g.18997  ORF Transcript_12555/g.18997 Transcript_12555/m.18997 type:complete len:310 (+) Transcript_12555:133-1062(+)|eukprot:CAMPEP_0202705278 /NCGR_PEP_ID=MMETSP1385-20130828/17850_1 /ASSEMBLY_ACC=CAM_ASM_000861 /TAXON_ID=933848 /ORGANISM="Elphidium margaritaceum" /LENGTH=309 /DNA_ID=CAMNT_0049363477 /DNA_START=114 /DNA_END=1043 /DNA_ORIENTATION=+
MAKTVKKQESPALKLLISGGVTICFEACAGGHYLEMLKILKQTSGDTYWTITSRMTAEKGLIGVLDGFMPWGAIQAAVKGSSFGFGQAFCRVGLEHVTFLETWQKDVLSGGGGGFVQGVIMSPTLLLKTRVMTDPRFRSTGGFFATSYHSLKLGKELIVTEGGLMSLTKGMGVFSFKRFCDWTTRFGFCVMVEELYKIQKFGDDDSVQRKLKKSEQMACSLAGGTLSALATIPIDVMVATIQQADKKGEKVSVMKIMRTKLQQHGFVGVMQLSTRGLIPRVAHVALTVMLMKTMSSWIYEVVTKKNVLD